MIDHQFFAQEFWGNSIRSYCLFAGIILLGIFFRRVVSRLLSLLLYKLFEKFAQEVKDATFVALLLKPIASFITLCTFYLAINQLKYPLELTLFKYRHLVDKVKVRVDVTIGEAIDKVFLFLIILSVFWIILRIIDFLAHVMLYKASLTESRTDDQLVPFLKELAKTTVCFIGFFVLLGFVFEINVLTLITGLGIGGIAIALAAKESLENLLGSFTIFLDKPFTVGDLVKVSGVEGTIEKVGFRSTWIRTSDKTIVSIPNKNMVSGVLENLSLRNFRRVKFSVGLTYETSAGTIKQIVAEIKQYLEEHKGTNQDGVCYFESFGDSSLNIEVIYFVETMPYNDFLSVKQEINYRIIEIVEQKGSDFAYPTRRVIGDGGQPAKEANLD